MKSFTSKSYNFSTVHIGQKLVYSTFLIFTFCGWLSIISFYCKRTGFSFQSLINYYCGNEEKLQYTKTYLELWEVSHFHLFTIPVIFLILAHLYMLSQQSDRMKVGVFLGGLVGMALDIGSPWLMVYYSPNYVVLKMLGRILSNVSLLIFMTIPFYEMWFFRKKKRKKGLSAAQFKKLRKKHKKK